MGGVTTGVCTANSGIVGLGTTGSEKMALESSDQVHAPSSPQDQFFQATMLPLIISSSKKTTCLVSTNFMYLSETKTL
jgi:hypothetical protein